MERIEDGASDEWELVRRFYECPVGSTRVEKEALAAVAACCLEPSIELASTVAQHCSWAVAGGENWRQSRTEEDRAHCDLVREILMNPFRPIAVDPSWLTFTVHALAEHIYQHRAFDQMPILADALQDAGCENEAVLDHCRQPGEHVRGCWVVDLVTGRK